MKWAVHDRSGEIDHTDDGEVCVINFKIPLISLPHSPTNVTVPERAVNEDIVLLPERSDHERCDKIDAALIARPIY